jgi:hypothetical protein
VDWAVHELAVDVMNRPRRDSDMSDWERDRTFLDIVMQHRDRPVNGVAHRDGDVAERTLDVMNWPVDEVRAMDNLRMLNVDGNTTVDHFSHGIWARHNTLWARNGIWPLNNAFSGNRYFHLDGIWNWTFNNALNWIRSFPGDRNFNTHRIGNGLLHNFFNVDWIRHLFLDNPHNGVWTRAWLWNSDLIGHFLLDNFFDRNWLFDIARNPDLKGDPFLNRIWAGSLHDVLDLLSNGIWDWFLNNRLHWIWSVNHALNDAFDSLVTDGNANHFGASTFTNNTGANQFLAAVDQGMSRLSPQSRWQRWLRQGIEDPWWFQTWCPVIVDATKCHEETEQSVARLSNHKDAENQRNEGDSEQ